MGAKLNFNFLFDYESLVNGSMVVSCTSISSKSLGQKYKLKELNLSHDVLKKLVRSSSSCFYRKILLYLSTTQVPVRAVDIGLPQLAMHSPYETAGVKDTEFLIKATEKFFA